MKFRVYLEETATRLFYKDIDAPSRKAAEKHGTAALESDAWTLWAESQSSASLELREELTSTVDADGRETLVEP
jgi:hypothetical protein